jgi:hypothetical protein
VTKSMSKKTYKPDTAWLLCPHGVRMRDGATAPSKCSPCRLEYHRAYRQRIHEERLIKRRRPATTCHHGVRMRTGARWASKCQSCQLERMRAYWDRVGKAKRQAYWQTYYLEVIKGAGRPAEEGI